MGDQNIITPEMQQKWFQSINNDFNYYFVIEYEGVEIGLINIKHIDYVQKSGESGIFIYDEQFHDKLASYRASLCQRDFAFETLGLDCLYAHILKDNPRSIKYNKKFGFKLLAGQDNENNQLYILTKEDYLIHRPEIIRRIEDVDNNELST